LPVTFFHGTRQGHHHSFGIILIGVGGKTINVPLVSVQMRVSVSIDKKNHGRREAVVSLLFGFPFTGQLNQLFPTLSRIDLRHAVFFFCIFYSFCCRRRRREKQVLSDEATARTGCWNVLSLGVAHYGIQWAHEEDTLLHA
jgi:hypothetical protein